MDTARPLMMTDAVKLQDTSLHEKQPSPTDNKRDLLLSQDDLSLDMEDDQPVKSESLEPFKESNE